jgi:hypothetical protein
MSARWRLVLCVALGSCLAVSLAWAGDVSVTPLSYRGWQGSFLLSNGSVEAVVVPRVGRVMQFRFVGGGDVFWENRDLDGVAADPASKEWTNFGGDKTWPAPQDDWERVAGRGWPPPPAFDAMPAEAQVVGRAVEMVSPLAPGFGLRARRRIELDGRRPVLRITTVYEKLTGEPIRVGVGVITQVRDPNTVFLLPPPRSRFPQGYVRLHWELPQDLKVGEGLVSLRRAQRTESQIGSDAGTLLWMDDKYVLRVDSPRVGGGEYGDQGSSTEVYTSRDPHAYVELETFGPLRRLAKGERIERTNVYTLLRRTRPDPWAEARSILRPGR